ncbi:PREDICTED: rho GTPase-activating protein 19-like [Priapulus caudatus]|uniref:Rho GTPase-activating protein 19-like n=1 Tax=Priapulus caudatus TaxID=37621 RepID=A0ABM1E8M9_PRICU|nr:PREDICTED: rho GTPase-activating protein 19-like [Priapulus caudatus]
MAQKRLLLQSLVPAIKTDELDRMRTMAPERFVELCLMHLTFALELGSSELNQILSTCNGAERAKKMVKPMTPFSKRRNSRRTSLKGGIFGATLTQEGISQVFQLIQYLGRNQNIKQVGLFRKSGQMSRQKELTTLLDQGVAIDLDSGRFSAHDCACVLKRFLGELPEPLLTENHYLAHCQISKLMNEESAHDAKVLARQVKAVQLLFLLLPPETYRLLRDLLNLLHRVTEVQEDNRMNADNLGTMFAPHILCPRKMTATELHKNAINMTKAVAFMIKHAPDLFTAPVELTMDVRAYWAQQDEYRQLENKSSGTPNVEPCRKYMKRREADAVKTTVCFNDQKRSQQEEKSKNTEVHVAELYAHIQAMPESAKKRKLIKQFNKQNAFGTRTPDPYSSRKHSRSKSVGEHVRNMLFRQHKRQKSSGASEEEGLDIIQQQENLINERNSIYTRSMRHTYEMQAKNAITSRQPTAKATVISVREAKSPVINFVEVATGAREPMKPLMQAHRRSRTGGSGTTSTSSVGRCPDQCKCHRVLQRRCPSEEALTKGQCVSARSLLQSEQHASAGNLRQSSATSLGASRERLLRATAHNASYRLRNRRSLSSLKLQAGVARKSDSAITAREKMALRSSVVRPIGTRLAYHEKHMESPITQSMAVAPKAMQILGIETPGLNLL